MFASDQERRIRPRVNFLPATLHGREGLLAAPVLDDELDARPIGLFQLVGLAFELHERA